MFPKGRAGTALLLMRVALALMLMDDQWAALSVHEMTWPVVAGVVIAFALSLGVFTPLTCAASLLLQLMVWAAPGNSAQQIHFCILLDSVALGLLGPGGYSIDGRIFGRRKIVFPKSSDHDATR